MLKREDFRLERRGVELRGEGSEVSNETSALRAAPISDPNGAEPNGSEEDIFWHNVSQHKHFGVARSQAVKLGKLLNGDFERANLVLAGVANAKGNRAAYLAQAIRGIQQEQAEAEIAAAPRKVQSEAGVPAWVTNAREDGGNIRREGDLWRWGFSLYNDSGEQVGM